MELAKGTNVAASLEGFTQLPLFRQLALMLGAAASIALVFAVFLWTQDESMRELYGNLAEKDQAQIVQALDQHGIDYELNDATGAIMVAKSDVHEVRLKMASEGLPKGGGVGFDILQKEQEFGVSKFMESKRYQHALEQELARSVASVGHVDKARVHLAVPKESVFVRKRQQPSASVVVDLYPGRILSQEQVAAITHLVASSIPNMNPQQVTVVDEQGRLMTDDSRDGDMALNQDQFEYTRRVEDNYVERIENILTPMVGMDGVRAQVTANLDFTVTEKTEESYNPDLPALRSKQSTEEKSSGPGVEGVPGALSNQPPGEATVPEDAMGENGGGAQGRSRSRKQSTVNYELDRTVSHSRLPSGGVKRLSVAVVIDDRQVANEDGEMVREPWPEEEIERITSLVKEAVGYDVRRGDTVNIVNASFRPEPLEEVPEPPLWKQHWVWELGKKVVGGIMILLFLVAVLRPLLRSLATIKPPVPVPAEGELPEGDLESDQLTLSSEEQQREQTAKRLSGPDKYDDDLQITRQIAQEDPKRVAQVVRAWLASE